MKPLHRKAMSWFRPAARRNAGVPKTDVVSNDPAARYVAAPAATESDTPGTVEPTTPPTAPTSYSLVGW
jgi:hypothetical protein